MPAVDEPDAEIRSRFNAFIGTLAKLV